MDKNFSCADIELLMHIYAKSERFPKSDSEHYTWTVGRFIREGLIYVSKDSGSGYKTTDKGNKLIDMILSVPMPVPIWADPEDAKKRTGSHGT